jgi:hypothetical protein
MIGYFHTIIVDMTMIYSNSYIRDNVLSRIVSALIILDRQLKKYTVDVGIFGLYLDYFRIC